MASKQLVVFQVGKEEYAISIAQVKEIIRYGGSTRLPSMPAYMEGIINLRGKVIPVVDLAKRFGLVREQAEGVQALIVESVGQDIGVIVDAVTEVLRMDDTAIELVQTLSITGNFLRGIGKQGDRLLIIIDINKLFSGEDRREMKKVG